MAGYNGISEHFLQKAEKDLHHFKQRLQMAEYQLEEHKRVLTKKNRMVMELSNENAGLKNQITDLQAQLNELQANNLSEAW